MKRNKNIPSDLVFEWFKQIVVGLKYLHDQNCIHRDLKTRFSNYKIFLSVAYSRGFFLRNIFIKNNTLKIGDFGISKILKKAGTISNIGTPCYWPPELHREEEYILNSDVWYLI